MPANFLEKYKVPRIVLGLFIFFVCLFPNSDTKKRINMTEQLETLYVKRTRLQLEFETLNCKRN